MPPISVSLPAPPNSVSLPASPYSVLIPLFPNKILAPLFPQATNMALPVSSQFSTFARKPAETTAWEPVAIQSEPSLANSITTSDVESTP